MGAPDSPASVDNALQLSNRVVGSLIRLRRVAGQFCYTESVRLSIQIRQAGEGRLPHTYLQVGNRSLVMNRNALYASIMGLCLVASSSPFAGPESAGASIPVVLQLCGGALAVISGLVLLHSAFQQPAGVE